MKPNVLQRSSTGCGSRSFVKVRASSSAVSCRAAAPTAAAPPAQVDAAAFEQFLLQSQKQILTEAEQLDGSGRTFVQDRWERPGENAGEKQALTRIQEYTHVHTCEFDGFTRNSISVLRSASSGLISCLLPLQPALILESPDDALTCTTCGNFHGNCCRLRHHMCIGGR